MAEVTFGVPVGLGVLEEGVSGLWLFPGDGVCSLLGRGMSGGCVGTAPLCCGVLSRE